MGRKIGVLTSGGDSSGMNAALRAVVRTGIHYGFDVYGIRKGYEGLIDNQMYPMNLSSVGGIIRFGGTILQTARSHRFLEHSGRRKAHENMQALGMDSLIVIGGDGSFHGLHELISEFGVQGIGLPGTIDNDLYGTEFTIGFDTAVNTALEAINKIRDTASSHSRVFIVEVMGRHAGYIAVYTAIASGSEEILIPEHADNIEALVDRIRAGQARGKQSSIIVVAEGDGTGGAFSVKSKIEAIYSGFDIRVSILGHIQRGGNPSALDSLIASRMGYESILALRAGKTDVMIGYRGFSDSITYTPLKDTWEKKKEITQNWLEMSRVLSM
ncbi:MAG: 6-phosphofructokinase [Candidatus Margulisiibacteriota bacterium]